MSQQAERPPQELPARGTRTHTVTEANHTHDPPSAGAPTAQPILTLDLERRHVRWSADTHDNEHENKRSSKSCCIYHRPRRFDESGTESSVDPSDDDDDDSSSSDGGPAREDCIGADSPARRAPRRRKHTHHRSHEHSSVDGNGVESDGSSSSDGGPARRPIRRSILPITDSLGPGTDGAGSSGFG